MYHLFIDQIRKVNRPGKVVPLPGSRRIVVTPSSPPATLAGRDVIEGFSDAEAANILGIPERTLTSRIAWGREGLRVPLNDATRRHTFGDVEK
jgi:RNA polymerase sigma-70 factor (ECF subfamily)